MKRLRALSLGTKLNLALLAFLLLLGAATSALIIYGFNRTQDNATERSNAALEEQGKLALQTFVGGISSIGSLQLEAAAETGRRAALYLEAQPQAPDAPVDPSTLAVSASGHHYDSNPARITDLLVIRGVDPADPGVLDDIAFSAPLETVFPIVLQTFEGGVGGRDFDPIAIVFISTNGMTRYYPPTGIHEVLPADADFTERMEQIGPTNNPDRRTIWTPPYEDGGGQGQIITARTPVYDGDTFRGSLEVDISIARLTDQLNGVRPTPRGFAFYVDSAGALFRTQAFELLSAEAADNPQLAAILAAMRSGESRFPVPVETLDLQGEEFFIAYVPIAGPGGSVAAAAPVSDLTSQASLITAGIDDEGDRTLRVVIVAMSALFVVGLAGASYLNRAAIVRPIAALAAATRRVSEGDLSASVPVDRGDEIGELGASFNTMLEQLRVSERVLEQRVDERTRELGTLLAVSQNVASRIELEPLLESVLDQVHVVADYDRGSVQVFEDDAFTVRAVRDFGGGRDGYQTQMRVGMQLPIPDTAIWSQFQRNEPIILADVNADTPLARAYRSRLHADVDQTTVPSGSFMAIPLISQDRIVGSISIGRDETNFYTADHARLARAIASQVAIAVENARLYETSQRRTREIEAVVRADAELFSSLNLDVVLRALIDVVIDALHVDKVVVTLAEGESVRVRASHGLTPESIARMEQIYGERRDAGEPSLAQALTTIEDIALADPRVQSMLRGEGIRAVLDAPIRSPGGVVGGFGIAYTSDHRFTDDERRLASVIAERAAVAIQNAKLLDDTQRQARETEALLRADAELFKSLNLDAVLQSLVDIAVEVLGADKSMVLLHEGEIDVIRAVRDYSTETVRSFNTLLAGIPHEEPPPEGRTPQIYEDLSDAPDFIASALAGEGVASHISLPVHDQHRMLGVFGVSFLQKRGFSGDDLRLYSALADRAAVAIQNAELYEKAQHAASLEERQRLARELHDSVSQALYGIALGARTAKLRISESPATAVEPIEYVATLAEAGLAEMRALIFELRPESLETEGLIAAIEKQIASIRARHQISIDADLMDEPACRIEVKEALYRITQEALQNVVKHAAATRVTIELMRDDGTLQLTVADDGRGFDPSQEFPGHIGLHSMPERAAKLGGSVAVESAPGSGTRVIARIPA